MATLITHDPELVEGQTAESVWKPLYKIGAGAAVAVLIFMPIQMAVFSLWPPPETAFDWFVLFQDNALVGLLDMDLLLIVDFLLLGLVFLALSVALRRTSPSLIAIALTAKLVAVSTYMASTAAFEMLSLSNQYADATTESERVALLAIGETLVATWQATAFDVSYILAGIALFTVSAVMLRTRFFTRVTSDAGIVAGAFALAPPTVGTIGLVFR